MGETRESISTSSGTWQITKILIVGVDVGQGIQSVQPTVQWSAFQIEVRESGDRQDGGPAQGSSALPGVVGYRGEVSGRSAGHRIGPACV
jgi:hypothetical protein